MIDRFLSKTGVGIALLFIVIMLAYVNTLSLEIMFDNKWIYDVIFGTVGAVGYSIVTILVMRLSDQMWLKNVFPVFDAALMFCGFNLKHWDDMFDNPVRFVMSVFLSLFSGLITYSLGQINADQHSGEAEANNLLKSAFEKMRLAMLELQGKFDAVQRNYDKLQGNYEESRRNEKLLKEELENVRSEVAGLRGAVDSEESSHNLTIERLRETQSKLDKAAAEAAKYKGAALAAEVARIRKKAEKNRTPEEIELLKEAA